MLLFYIPHSALYYSLDFVMVNVASLKQTIRGYKHINILYVEIILLVDIWNYRVERIIVNIEYKYNRCKIC